MKKILFIAVAICSLAFTACNNNKTPEDYAAELVQLTIDGMEAQLNGASPDEIAKFEDRINEIEKEVKEINKENPDFEAQLMETYQKELTSNPKYQELIQKAMQQYMEMENTIETLDIDPADGDILEMAEEAIEEVNVPHDK